MKPLSKEKIIKYLKELSDEMGKQNLKGEILLFGGAAMVLAFNARPSTKDIDAIFRPKREIYAISKQIAETHLIPESWLNDSVKGFLTNDSFEQKLYFRFENLSVYIPDPDYLLAMKCISMRIGMESSDVEDIKFLIRHLHIKKSEKIIQIIEKYYPKNQIPQKTFYAIEEILEQILNDTSL
jgi:hypothetical protein